MILDPFGEVLAESRALADDVVVGLLTPEKIDVVFRPPLSARPAARSCTASWSSRRSP